MLLEGMVKPASSGVTTPSLRAAINSSRRCHWQVSTLLRARVEKPTNIMMVVTSRTWSGSGVPESLVTSRSLRRHSHERDHDLSPVLV